MTPDQILILLTGVPAVFLSQSADFRWRRWACVFGLAGQYGWFVAAMNAQQWGIFLISILYTFAWTKGVYTNWYLPWRLHAATR